MSDVSGHDQKTGNVLNRVAMNLRGILTEDRRQEIKMLDFPV